MFVETKLFALDWIGPPLEHSMSALPLTTTHHHYDTVYNNSKFIQTIRHISKYNDGHSKVIIQSRDHDDG